MFDFPSNPAYGTTVTLPDGSFRVWDSQKWRAAPSGDTVMSDMFLPLTGGTVSGDIVANNAALRATYAQNVAGPFHAVTSSYGSLTGVTTTSDGCLALIQTTSDTLDAGGSGLIGHSIKLTAGGPGTAGNRIGQYIDTQFSGSTLDKARGWAAYYAGQWIYAKASGNVGGLALNNSYGALWGGLSSATLQSGATFWMYAVGHEVNVGVSTGASAAFVQGLKVAVQNHNQPSNATDFLFGLGKVALTDQGFLNGIMFGVVDGYWPITSNGTLIGTQPSALATPPAMTAGWGIDFSAVAFSSGFARSPGFSVDGSGYVSAAGASLSYGQIFTAALPASQTDLTHHLKLFDGGAGNQFGLSASWPGSGNAHLNYVVGINADHMFMVNNASVMSVTATGLAVTGSVAATGGHHCGSTVASGVSDFSKQIDLYGGQAGITVTGDTNTNYVGFSSGFHVFYIGATQAGFIGPASVTSVGAIQCGGNSGPTWTTGSGVPSSTQPVGSLYSRVSTWAAGATLYVSKGAGAWTAVASV